MGLIDNIQFPNDDNLEMCIFYKKEVKHFYSGENTKPDCSTCDGYGEKAKKYSWDCYKPKREFEK